MLTVKALLTTKTIASIDELGDNDIAFLNGELVKKSEDGKLFKFSVIKEQDGIKSVIFGIRVPVSQDISEMTDDNIERVRIIRTIKSNGEILDRELIGEDAHIDFGFVDRSEYLADDVSSEIAGVFTDRNVFNETNTHDLEKTPITELYPIKSITQLKHLVSSTESSFGFYGTPELNIAESRFHSKIDFVRLPIFYKNKIKTKVINEVEYEYYLISPVWYDDFYPVESHYRNNGKYASSIDLGKDWQPTCLVDHNYVCDKYFNGDLVKIVDETDLTTKTTLKHTCSFGNEIYSDFIVTKSGSYVQYIDLDIDDIINNINNIDDSQISKGVSYFIQEINLDLVSTMYGNIHKTFGLNEIKLFIKDEFSRVVELTPSTFSLGSVLSGSLTSINDKFYLRLEITNPHFTAIKNTSFIRIFNPYNPEWSLDLMLPINTTDFSTTGDYYVENINVKVNEFEYNTKQYINSVLDKNFAEEFCSDKFSVNNKDGLYYETDLKSENYTEDVFGVICKFLSVANIVIANSIVVIENNEQEYVYAKAITLTNELLPTDLNFKIYNSITNQKVCNLHLYLKGNETYNSISINHPNFSNIYINLHAKYSKFENKICLDLASNYSTSLFKGNEYIYITDNSSEYTQQKKLCSLIRRDAVCAIPIINFCFLNPTTYPLNYVYDNTIMFNIDSALQPITREKCYYFIQRIYFYASTPNGYVSLDQTFKETEIRIDLDIWDSNYRIQRLVQHPSRTPIKTEIELDDGWVLSLNPGPNINVSYLSISKQGVAISSLTSDSKIVIAKAIPPVSAEFNVSTCLQKINNPTYTINNIVWFDYLYYLFMCLFASFNPIISDLKKHNIDINDIVNGYVYKNETTNKFYSLTEEFEDDLTISFSITGSLVPDNTFTLEFNYQSEATKFVSLLKSGICYNIVLKLTDSEPESIYVSIFAKLESHQTTEIVFKIIKMIDEITISEFESIEFISIKPVSNFYLQNTDELSQYDSIPVYDTQESILNNGLFTVLGISNIFPAFFTPTKSCYKEEEDNGGVQITIQPFYEASVINDYSCFIDSGNRQLWYNNKSVMFNDMEITQTQTPYINYFNGITLDKHLNEYAIQKTTESSNKINCILNSSIKEQVQTIIVPNGLTTEEIKENNYVCYGNIEGKLFKPKDESFVPSSDDKIRMFTGVYTESKLKTTKSNAIEEIVNSPLEVGWCLTTFDQSDITNNIWLEFNLHESSNIRSSKLCISRLMVYND